MKNRMARIIAASLAATTAFTFVVNGNVFMTKVYANDSINDMIRGLTKLSDEEIAGILSESTEEGKSRVSVHDPSVVGAYVKGNVSRIDKDTITMSEPSGEFNKPVYFIFGSHMAWAYSFDLENWASFTNNINSQYESIFAEDIKWSALGSKNYDVSGNLWAPDIIYNEKLGKWCMYMSVNGDKWYTSVVMLTADTLGGDWTRVDSVVYSGFTNVEQAEKTDFFDVYRGTITEEIITTEEVEKEVVCPVATIGNKTGDNTYELAWWNYQNFYKQLVDEGDFELTYRFHNDSAGAENFQNYALAFVTDTQRGNELDKGEDWYLRADRCSNAAFTGSEITYDNTIDWDTFRHIMKNADVEVTVKRSGTTMVVDAKVTGENGESFTNKATATNCPTQAMAVYLGGENCQISLNHFDYKRPEKIAATQVDKTTITKTIGTENEDGSYALDWWVYSNFQKEIVEEGDFTLNYSFHNTSAGKANCENYAISFAQDLNRVYEANDGSDWNLRSDLWSNHTFTNSEVSYDATIDWDTFLDTIKDSDVDVTITRSGSTIVVDAKVEGANGKSFTNKATATNCPTGSLAVYLGGENCKVAVYGTKAADVQGDEMKTVVSLDAKTEIVTEIIQKTETREVEAPHQLPDRYKERNNGNAHYSLNAIDPCVIYDENGDLWMTYGSWFGGIYMLKLDTNTGLRDYSYTYETQVNESDVYQGLYIAGGNNVSGEASYIQKINGKYYLFMSYGGLVANGGYNMRVFSSDSITGPYVDASGEDARRGMSMGSTISAKAGSITGDVGTKLMANYKWSFMNYAEVAQGHNSAIVDEDGNAYVVYHTRTNDGTEGHSVRVHTLYTTKSGYLTASPFEHGEGDKQAASYSLMDLVGSYEIILQDETDYANLAYNKGVNITLNPDGSVSGAKTGSWSMEGKDLSITLGATTYEAVIAEQYIDGSKTSTIVFSGVSQVTDHCLWGYKLPTGELAVANESVYDVPTEIASNISLATESIYDAKIYWESSNPQVISPEGIVTRQKEDTQVVLTRTVISGDYYYQKEYPITIFGTESENASCLASYAKLSAGSKLDAIDEISAKTGVAFTFTLDGYTSDWTPVMTTSDATVLLSVLHYAGADLYEAGGQLTTAAREMGYEPGSEWTIFTDGKEHEVTISYNVDGSIDFYRDGILMIQYGASTLINSYPTNSTNTVKSLSKAMAKAVETGDVTIAYELKNVTVSYAKDYDPSSAEKEYDYEALYSYYADYEKYGEAADWASGACTIAMQSREENNYVKLTPTGSGNRGAILSFALNEDEIAALTNKDYTLSLDVALASGNVKDRSNSEFVITNANSTMGKNTNARQNANVEAEDSVINAYILRLSTDMCTAAKRQTTWYINGDREKAITLGEEQFVNIKLVYDAENSSYALTIADCASGEVIYEGTETPKGDGQIPTGIYTMVGRGNGVTAVDNLKFYEGLEDPIERLERELEESKKEEEKLEDSEDTKDPEQKVEDSEETNQLTQGTIVYENPIIVDGSTGWNTASGPNYAISKEKEVTVSFENTPFIRDEKNWSNFVFETIMSNQADGITLRADSYGWTYGDGVNTPSFKVTSTWGDDWNRFQNACVGKVTISAKQISDKEIIFVINLEGGEKEEYLVTYPDSVPTGLEFRVGADGGKIALTSVSYKDVIDSPVEDTNEEGNNPQKTPEKTEDDLTEKLPDDDTTGKEPVVKEETKDDNKEEAGGNPGTEIVGNNNGSAGDTQKPVLAEKVEEGTMPTNNTSGITEETDTVEKKTASTNKKEKKKAHATTKEVSAETENGTEELRSDNSDNLIVEDGQEVVAEESMEELENEEAVVEGVEEAIEEEVTKEDEEQVSMEEQETTIEDAELPLAAEEERKNNYAGPLAGIAILIMAGLAAVVAVFKKRKVN